MRVEVERIDPGGLDTLESTRELLILAGQVAEDDFTRPPSGEIERRAMAEEREAYCGYIRGLTLAGLNEVEPLPYRRVLADEESKAIWSRLRVRWEVQNDTWYPLAECGLPGVAAFDSRAFSEVVSHQRIQDALASRGVLRVWELREYGPEYEEDVSLCEPSYNGAEGYWSSNDLGWILFASHEGTITVGGWLLQCVQELWPSWQAHLWQGSVRSQPQ